MALMSRKAPAWLLILLFLCLAGGFHEAYMLHRLQRLDRAIADPARIALTADSIPELVFAKARYLDQIGETTEAIRLYGSIQSSQDPQLRERVLYNLATIYLEDAAKLWNQSGVLQYARVNTLIELAKENYRDVLRLNPDNWDARFNLEYAYRITPPPKEKAKADWRGSKSSVFSTLPGIPGGGP